MSEYKINAPRCADCKFFRQVSNLSGNCLFDPPKVFSVHDPDICQIVTQTAHPLVNKGNFCRHHSPPLTIEKI